VAARQEAEKGWPCEIRNTKYVTDCSVFDCGCTPKKQRKAGHVKYEIRNM